MDTAVTYEGKSVAAGEDAPGTAVCPHCGNPVSLRRRRSMSGEVTYFWRHRSGFTTSCRGRFSPFRPTRRNGKEA